VADSTEDRERKVMEATIMRIWNTEVSPQYLIDKYKERFGENHTSNLLIKLWTLGNARGGLIKKGKRDYRISGMFYKPKPKTRRKNA
tara:strand:- start:878 stop:1138 length:261 start_codon:yes stop_codon:yes gene_type:complete